MNKVMLIGRLTRDAELKILDSGMVLSFTIAADRDYTNKNGEKVTDFIPVSYWTDNGERLVEYLKKGRLIGVSGCIRVKSYKDQEEKTRYFTDIRADEIKFLDSMKKESVL